MDHPGQGDRCLLGVARDQPVRLVDPVAIPSWLAPSRVKGLVGTRRLEIVVDQRDEGQHHPVEIGNPLAEPSDGRPVEGTATDDAEIEGPVQPPTAVRCAAAAGDLDRQQSQSRGDALREGLVVGSGKHRLQQVFGRPSVAGIESGTRVGDAFAQEYGQRILPPLVRLGQTLEIALPLKLDAQPLPGRRVVRNRGEQVRQRRRQADPAGQKQVQPAGRVECA